jgi:hypothetical protein
VEAQNTIYGDGRGSIAGGSGVFQDPSCTTPTNGFPCLPPDGEDGNIDGIVDTHLINFGPQAEGTIDVKPKWAYVYDSTLGAYRFKCFLRCHNETMNTCAYQTLNDLEEAADDRFNSVSQPTRGTVGVTWCAGGASTQ